MNNHDIDTGLPYVAFCRVSDIDPHESHHRQLGVSADTRLYTEDQVRAAIEAARQRRGEPVAWVGAEHIKRLLHWKGVVNAKNVTLYYDQGERKGLIPLYAAPQSQPANPVVKESLTVAEPPTLEEEEAWQRLERRNE